MVKSDAFRITGWALSVEAAELLEHFQWLTDAQSSNLALDEKEKVRLEMADVLLYLIRRQNIDILDINVSDITTQYMVYVELMSADQFELSGDRRGFHRVTKSGMEMRGITERPARPGFLRNPRRMLEQMSECGDKRGAIRGIQG